MLLEKSHASATKGWCFGPWNSVVLIPVDYVNTGVDQTKQWRRVHD